MKIKFFFFVFKYEMKNLFKYRIELIYSVFQDPDIIIWVILIGWKDSNRLKLTRNLGRLKIPIIV